MGGSVGVLRRANAVSCCCAGRRRHRLARLLALLPALLAFIILSPTARADAPPPSPPADSRLTDGPSLADLLITAYQNSPAIAAARHGWRAAVERVRVAEALPDPTVSATVPIETRIGDEEWGVSIAQGIPFPGRLSAEGDVATAEVAISRAEYEKTVRDVAASVRESAHELAYVREARSIAAGNRDLLAQLLASGTAAYAQDRSTLIDLAKASSQTGQVAYDEHLLEELESVERIRLNSLLGRSPDLAVGPLVLPPVTPIPHLLEDLTRLAEESRPELAIARARVEKADRELIQARYRILPDVEVGLFANVIEETDPAAMVVDNRTGVKSVGATVSVPLPVWLGKNFGRTGEARAAAEQARAELRALENDTRAAVSRQFFRLRNAERLVRLYGEELIPRAAKAVETAETWFREGRGSLSDFTETRAVWYNFRLALARATADHGQILAALETLAGRSLSGESSGQPVVPGSGAKP